MYALTSSRHTISDTPLSAVPRGLRHSEYYYSQNTLMCAFRAASKGAKGAVCPGPHCEGQFAPGPIVRGTTNVLQEPPNSLYALGPRTTLGSPVCVVGRL